MAAAAVAATGPAESPEVLMRDTWAQFEVWAPGLARQRRRQHPKERHILTSRRRKNEAQPTKTQKSRKKSKNRVSFIRQDGRSAMMTETSTAHSDLRKRSSMGDE